MNLELKTGDKYASVYPNNYTSLMLNTWLAFQVFKQVATSIKGTVTAQNFLAAMNQAKFSGLRIIPPLDFAHPKTVPGVGTHMFNDVVILQKWDPTKSAWTLTGARVSGASALG
jgi:hypothetical protein